MCPCKTPVFCVIVTIRGQRPEVHGPFTEVMAAHDYALAHTENTGLACELRPLAEPIVYGDQGL